MEVEVTKLTNLATNASNIFYLEKFLFLKYLITFQAKIELVMIYVSTFLIKNFKHFSSLSSETFCPQHGETCNISWSK